MPIASEQTSGPVLVWVGVPNVSGAKPMFFGTGENAPEPEFIPEYENVMNDLRGTRKPFDKIFEGEDAPVTITTTFWVEDTLDFLMDFVNLNNGQRGDGIGQQAQNDIGTLMFLEKQYFELWLVYPYAVTHPFMTVNGANMKRGYHFFAAIMDGPIRRSNGTKVNKVAASSYCGGLPKSSSDGKGMNFVTYDDDMGAVVGQRIQTSFQ